MADIEQQRRLQILANPTEERAIECKSWLDLSDNKNKAKLAKAAIAMANSGGGTIVIGISEDETNGKELVCKPRPSDIAQYSNNAVGSAINKYAEPELEARLVFEGHPDTGDEYAFVEIAGGMQQPVFAKRQFDGEIEKLACYIRKPGPPRSEVPHTAQEWRDLMTRCVRASRESMLDSIRIIMNGRLLDTTPSPSEEDKLREFMRESKERWQERLQEVEEDDVARLKHGYWAFAFSVLDAQPWPSLNDLHSTIDKVRGQDWLRSAPFMYDEPGGRYQRAARDAIESWLGDPELMSFRDPFWCSYWRAMLSGQFFHLEGFYEDRLGGEMGSGNLLDISVSIKRYAQAFMFAARMGEIVGEESEVLIRTEMIGTEGRRLSSNRIWFLAKDNYICREPSLTLPVQRFAPKQIDENLEEVLLGFLHRLYEQFNLYDLKRQFVAAELQLLRRGRLSWLP